LGFAVGRFGAAFLEVAAFFVVVGMRSAGYSHAARAALSASCPAEVTPGLQPGAEPRPAGSSARLFCILHTAGRAGSLLLGDSTALVRDKGLVLAGGPARRRRQSDGL
jgi:hypothetical protein